MIAAEVRERLGHPVIDCDAHGIEYLPLVRDFVVEESGEATARGFDATMSTEQPDDLDAGVSDHDLFVGSVGAAAAAVAAV